MRRLPRARFWFPFLACFLIGLLCYHHYYSNSLNRVKNATPLDPMHALKLKHSKTIKILIDAGTVPQFMSIQKMEELLYEEQDLAHIQKLRLNNLKKYCRKHPDAWAVHKDRRVSTQLMAKRHFEKYGRFYSVLEPYKYYECRVAKAATTARSFVLWAAFHQGRNIHDFPYYHPVNDPEIVKMNTVKGRELQAILSNYFGAIYVREPLSKIISAYFNKFCDPDRKDTFKERFEIETLGTPTLGQVLKALANKNLTDILSYDDHFTSYFRYCNPCLSNFSFVGRFETHSADLDYMVHNKTALHRGMSYAIHEAPVSPPFHDCPYDRNHPEAFKDVDMTDILKLVEIHKHDYQAFGYDPNVMLKYIQKKILQSQSV